MLSRLRQLSHSHDARTLVSNFIYLILLKAVSVVFPLITLPYLARVIGPDSFGAIAFASAIIAIVETVTDWGFNYTATRDVAQCREDISKVSRIFSEVFFSRLLLTLVCFLLLWVAVDTIPDFREFKVVILITFLYIPGNIMFPEWLFQAMEDMKYITIFNIVSRLIFTMLIFVVIKVQSDYIYQPLLIACGYFVSGVAAQVVIYRKFGVRLRLPDWRSAWTRLRRSTDMFISLIMPNLYTNFSTMLLTGYCGEGATGIYSGATRFQSLIDQFTQILSRTFFPFLARHKEKHHVYVLISGAISLVACAMMFFGADLFVRIFLTPEFAAAADVIKIFAITPFFLFLMNTYGTNYLVIAGKENILRNIIVSVSVVGFVLTWILTPKYSYLGMAATITIVWGVRGVATWWCARRVKAKLASAPL